MPGLEHKYDSTALLLISNACAGICRYCFRKRVFLKDKQDHIKDMSAALNYVSKHREITNVLLTGGDPLMLPTDQLEEIITKLRRINHVKIIRIGTRMPVYNPHRIAEDKKLLDLIKTHSSPRRKIYIMTHFMHPRELTDIATQTCHLLQKAGAVVTNQTPLRKGVNDDPEILAELFAKLSFCGIIPYYTFQCRPASGNKAYTVPIETGYEIIEKAKAKVSGLAKRIRFVMSHSSGKIEIIGKTDTAAFMKYHRAANNRDSGKIMIFKSNPKALWFDDYEEVNYPVNQPYRSYGPE
jgi:KamA family protein